MARCAHGADSCGYYRTIQEFDDVEDFLVAAMDGGAGAELQEAARVGSDDGLSSGGFDMMHFFRK